MNSIMAIARWLLDLCSAGEEKDALLSECDLVHYELLWQIADQTSIPVTTFVMHFTQAA